MKKISISIPCRNEQENIQKLCTSLIYQLCTFCSEYDYEIQFIDNCSTDKTREILRNICAENKKVRAIFNIANFPGSAHHGIFQTTGDCCIHMAADFQDPPEMIVKFIREWEKGYKVVYAKKTSSKENKLMWLVRCAYYKIMQAFTSTNQLEHFTGFGLYDRDFIEIYRSLKDSVPSLKGIVAEYGYKMTYIEFVQPKRRGGKTKNNFFTLFDFAMKIFTTYSRSGMRIATFFGLFIALISAAVGVIYLVLKLIYWHNFAAGFAPIIIGTFFIGSMQLIFIGLLGEYVMTMNTRIMNRPLAIEEERINFND